MLLSLLLVVVFTVNAHSVLAYTPQKGDYFDYSETVTVNNGQGSYSGYTDQTLTTGTEQMNSVDGSIVMAAYRSSYQFSNSQGSSTSGSYSGAFTWSSSNFTYVNGTDDQTGYSKPTYVWFAMNPSLPVGGTFEILNTQFTVLSKDYSLQLPTEGDEYVQTIQAKGTGEYQRNDEYGIFTASYTWNAYFDSSTGYIVGYNYVEQDNGQYQGQAGSFTYTDDLYVTATSYTLALASAAGTSLIGTVPYISYLVVLVVVVLIIAIVVYVATRGARRKNRLPEHSHVPSSPPAPSSSPTPWESKTDLGSRPPEQVVIKEVAKVNCKYCGTLIPTTVDRCPYCGGPRQ
jgi:hypothetical protein